MPSKTIKSIVSDINNEESDGGGLWLPNIQRLFVWEEEQIEKLFDSIMRRYPLPSMMLWKTREPIRHRKFIDQYHESFDLKSLYRPDNKKLKRLVLDGQQRLQSFYIGLKGSINGKVLKFDLLSGNIKNPEEIAYRFSFKKQKENSWPWVPFSSIIDSRKLPEDIVDDIVKQNAVNITDEERRTITRNISRAKREFEVTGAILYQELDGTDEDSSYAFDDVVEIFIRANSGGTTLSKSDLMFTLLTSQWDVADVEMDEFLVELNDNRFKFSRDFVIKVAMTLLGQGAKYDVGKLRDEQLRKKIADSWIDITRAISFVRDQLISKTFIRCDQALISYNALIPLIYFRYHFPDSWKSISSIKDYLLRTLLTGSFSGSPDGLIDKITADIQAKQSFDKKSIFRIIEGKGKSLKIYSDTLLGWGYGSGQIHLLFNQWYSNDYRPAFNGHIPQVDHIFPQSLLKSVKEINPDTGRPCQHYNAWQINQLSNCMLLTAQENGAGDKSDTPPDVWLNGKTDEFLELHCIPKRKSLWKIENYEKFIEARGKLLIEKFQDLLLDEEE